MIKTGDTCLKCKWSIDNPGCSYNETCRTCTHRDKYGGCLCSTIYGREDCPYYEPYQNSPCSYCSSMHDMVGPVKIMSQRAGGYDIRVELNFCPVCGSYLRKE